MAVPVPVTPIAEDEASDPKLKRLKKKLQHEGILREMKLRRHFEKPAERRKREAAEAVRRARKLERKRLERGAFEEIERSSKVAEQNNKVSQGGVIARPDVAGVDKDFLDAVDGLLRVAIEVVADATRRNDEIDAILAQIRMVRSQPVQQD